MQGAQAWGLRVVIVLSLFPGTMMTFGQPVDQGVIVIPVLPALAQNTSSVQPNSQLLLPGQPLYLDVVTTPSSAPAETRSLLTPKATAPESGLLMESLQGTWYGAMLDDSRLVISGWIQGSFTASTDARTNLPMAFNYQANNFLMQQNWIHLERTVDQSTTTPSWGFMVDSILPGSDYRFTLARGLLNQQLTADHGSPNIYGIDIVQFLSDWYVPGVGQGLDIKLGRFFSPFGVESIGSPQNPLVSHSYSFIYDPYTNTGLLTTLKITDEWSIQNGLTTGSDVLIDPAANPTYVGGIKWAAEDNLASADFQVIIGNGRYNQSRSFNNPEIFDLVLMRQFSDRLTWTGEALYGFQTNVPGIGFVNWFGVVNYLSYQIDPRLIANARLEFFDDVQGQRTQYKGLYDAITTGVTYKPCSYLMLRPEIRFDYNNNSHAFEGKAGLFTAALDCIFLW
jgi:hypothetical protein